jgi:hypothetical protein
MRGCAFPIALQAIVGFLLAASLYAETHSGPALVIAVLQAIVFILAVTNERGR